MINKEDRIEDILKKVPSNWKEKVDIYQDIITAIKENCSVILFDNNVNLLKIMIDECNAFALEKALEVVVIYLRVSDCGKRNLLTELQIFVEKCFKSSRQQTRQYGIEIFVILSEKCLQEVTECLLPFLSDKKPVIVNGIIDTFIQFFLKYKNVPIKKLLQFIPKLFESRDKETRTLTKTLTLTIATVYGKNAIEPALKELKPILSNDIRSDLEEAMLTQKNTVLTVCDEDNGSSTQEEDNIQNLPLVNLTMLLIPTFYDQLDGSRQERKEALDFLHSKINNKRISNGNYRELVSKLCQIVTKDSQINSIQIALGILTIMAKTLGKSFANCSSAVIDSCLEKFKEKKLSVLSLTRECIDAVYSTTSFEQCLPAIIEALENKNPTIRSETVAFLLRISAKKQVNEVIKKQAMTLLPVLRRLCDDGVVDVRDVTFQMLGRLHSASNLKMIDGLLIGLDNAKIQRIKSFVSKEDLIPLPVVQKNEVKYKIKEINKSVVAKVVAKPVNLSVEDMPKKKIVAAVGKQQKEFLLSSTDIEEKFSIMFGEENVKKMSNPVWGNRVKALDSVIEHIKKTPLDKEGCQIVVRFMLAKPGLKESHFTVLRKKIEIIQIIFRDHNASGMIAELCIQDIVEKVGDQKVGLLSKSVLNLLFQAIVDLTPVVTKVLQACIESKSVKCMTELIDWLVGYLNSNETRAFSPKELVPLIRQLLNSPNQTVKQKTILLIATLYKISGRFIVNAFESEKPAIVEMIEKEVSKVDVIKMEEKKIEKLKQKQCTDNIKVIQKEDPKVEVAVVSLVDESNVRCSSSGSFCESGSNFKDNARFFVLDLCEKLNMYIDEYSPETLETELGEIYSSIMSMGDERMRRSVMLLSNVLKRNTVFVKTISTQTDEIQNPPASEVFVTPQQNFITHRRHKKDRRDIEECPYEDDIIENILMEEKANVFREIGNVTQDRVEKTSVKDAIDSFNKSTAQPVIALSLNKLLNFLKTGKTCCIREEITPLIMSITKRLTDASKEKITCEHRDACRSEEVEKTILLLSKIYSQKYLYHTVGDKVLSQLLYLLCSLMSNINGEYFHVSKETQRSINNLILQIVEATDFTKILFCLLSILDQCFEKKTYKCPVSNMIVKLFWNRMKIIKESQENAFFSDEYFVRILITINKQFSKYISDDDIVNSTAFKSVKTLVDSLTKVMGLRLLNFIPKDDNKNFVKYIHHCQERATKS